MGKKSDRGKRGNGQRAGIAMFLHPRESGGKSSRKERCKENDKQRKKRQTVTVYF